MTDQPPPTRFAHQRLDGYRVAFELFRGVEDLARDLPRGYADFKDQLRRAGSATVRDLAEGANRIHPRDKAARFIVARGEVGETDAALEMVAALGLAGTDRIRRMRMLADRVAAMTWGLIRRERLRQAPRTSRSGR